MLKDNPQQSNPLPTLAINESERRAKIFAALSDPTRLQIVELLAAKAEMSGSEIASQLGISLALFCHHSKTLVEAGLTQQRREGQTKYNSLKRDILSACLESFLWLNQTANEERLKNTGRDELINIG